jgi:hypothetical protein
VTITANSTTNTSTASITFNVIPPSWVAQEYSDTYKHQQGQADLGIEDSLYVGPDSVNFYKIQTLEQEVDCTATGAYSCINDTGHGPSKIPATYSQTVVSGLGTMANAIDSCYTGLCLGNLTPGYVYWYIPCVYSLTGTPNTNYAYAAQIGSLAADGTTVTMSKNGGIHSIQVSDPTVP